MSRFFNFIGKHSTGASLFLFALSMTLLYAPYLGKSFSADDFKVVLDVSKGRIFNFNGFFRPLSDFSFWLTFKFFGTNPTPYFLFNYLIHFLNVSMIYIVSARLGAQFFFSSKLFPFFCALFFLFYPFHNEPLFWAVGRGASLALFFALLCIFIASQKNSSLSQYLLVFLFYSIGLLAYETILPLGFILMMLEYSSQDNRKKRVIDYALLTLLVLTLHFLLRIFFSGNLFQGYAANIPNSAPGLLFNHIIRIVARQFVPPIANTFIFVCISLSVLLLIGFIIVRVKSSVRKFQENRALFYFLLVGWLVSMLVAFSFPVSTKTSESDRLLYLPSMFLCSIFAYAIVVFLRSLIIRGGVVVLYCSAGALGIFQNASHWQIASKQTLEIIASVARYAEKGKNVYVINLPDQVQGAFVFRNGFYPALLLNKVDTTGIRLGAAIIQNSEGSRVANQDGSIVGKLVKENAICLEWDGKLLQKVFPVATSKP